MLLYPFWKKGKLRHGVSLRPSIQTGLDLRLGLPAHPCEVTAQPGPTHPGQGQAAEVLWRSKGLRTTVPKGSRCWAKQESLGWGRVETSRVSNFKTWQKEFQGCSTEWLSPYCVPGVWGHGDNATDPGTLSAVPTACLPTTPCHYAEQHQSAWYNKFTLWRGKLRRVVSKVESIPTKVWGHYPEALMQARQTRNAQPSAGGIVGLFITVAIFIFHLPITAAAPVRPSPVLIISALTF